MDTYSTIDRLTVLQKISIVLLLIFSTSIPNLFIEIIGISDFPDEELMWVLPVCILLFHNVLKTLAKVSKELVLFLILIVFFYISEQKFYRGYNYSSDYAYFFGFLKFYTIYFSLLVIDKPIIVLKYIIKASQIIIIPLIIFFYFDYFSGGSAANKLSIDDSRYINQFNFHINGLSYIATYGIFITIIAYKLGMKAFNKTLITCLFFLGIIMLNSSRGAFLMSVACLLFFFSISFKNLPNKIKPFFIIMVIAILVFGALQLNFIFSDVVVVRRIVNNEGTGRITQMAANMNNIVRSPFMGVGQSLAGYDNLLRTTRSNVHFMQSLAAYGIVLAFFYFYFMFRIMGPIKRKTNIVTKMTLVIFVVTFFSYNWTLILLLSFMAFANKTIKEIK